MQLFPCPFCGEHDEREFLFLGELGKTRPVTDAVVSETEWGSYLHTRRNDMGCTREIWMHLPCSEVFGMERDSVTMAVLNTITLREDTP